MRTIIVIWYDPSQYMDGVEYFSEADKDLALKFINDRPTLTFKMFLGKELEVTPVEVVKQWQVKGW